MTIKIGRNLIGLEHPTYFIADIAANHDGDLGKAKELIYSCAEAGAHAAKFQNFEAETIVSDYGFKNLGGQFSHQAKWKKSVFEVYKDASIPLDWTPVLKETCEKAGIDYFTSPYSLEIVEAVKPFVSAWKLGSGDITWTDEIEAMAKTRLPIIIATGASTIEDVRRAYFAAAKHNNNIVLMQCNTNYTANLNESREEALKRFSHLNIRVLETLAREFPGVSLGLSDHTHGHTSVLAAVGLFNARSVEKHYTLDNNAEGPDHPFSMNPKTWREMVEATKELQSKISDDMSYDDRYSLISQMVEDKEELQVSIGDGIKRVEANETQTIILQRRAIRVTKNLKAGHILTKDDLFPLRPCPANGLPPHKMSEIIGKPLKRDTEEGDIAEI